MAEQPSLDLLCIGEAMAELRQDASGAFVVGFAGDTYNTAVYAKRALGPKAKVGYFTRVGTDPLSAGFLAQARDEHLDLSAIITDDQRNIGLYSVSTDAQGERRFHYWRDRSAARGLFARQQDLASLPAAKLIYLSGISMAILSPSARHRLMAYLVAQQQAGGCTIAYDSNYRPSLWEDQATAQAVTHQMWQIADLAFPSIDDEMALFDDPNPQSVIDRFAAYGVQRCALKRGQQGPLAIGYNGALPAFAPAPKVVDTTAAGDSFNGGYLAASIQGLTEPECLLAGHQLAAHVVGQRGAIAPR